MCTTTDNEGYPLLLQPQQLSWNGWLSLDNSNIRVERPAAVEIWALELGSLFSMMSCLVTPVSQTGSMFHSSSFASQT